MKKIKIDLNQVCIKILCDCYAGEFLTKLGNVTQEQFELFLDLVVEDLQLALNEKLREEIDNFSNGYVTYDTDFGSMSIENGVLIVEPYEN